ncbi:MAG: response regulator [Minwuia sp.]|nr:response regulator [Minwuia sp.]
MEDTPQNGHPTEDEPHLTAGESLARADLLAAVSHEMRNSLNGLLGVSELLLTSQLDVEQRKHVNAIRACADGLRSLSVDMLDLSRMETGKLQLDAAPFCPAEMLEHVVSMTGPQAAAKCLHFEARFGGGVRQLLLGDRQRISQILLNLIGNAIKFTSGGQICIAASAGDHDAGTLLTFRVTDTGCGMEPAMIETLFKPWQRRSLHAESGSGLGLAISRRLARQMHGDITVHSTPGIGSTFTLSVSLPKAQPQPDDATVPSPVPGETRSGLRILVADDHHINRALLDAVLRKTGHEVVLVDNGRAAVDQAVSGSFDLVLMDIQMPELDGVAATREIRAREAAGQHLPILGVTGHDSARHREAFAACGMDGVVAKPFDLPSLLEKITRVVAAPVAPSRAEPVSIKESQPHWDPDSPLADTLSMIRQLQHAATGAGD